MVVHYLKDIYYGLSTAIKAFIIVLYMLVVGFFVLAYLLVDYLIGKLKQFARWF